MIACTIGLALLNCLLCIVQQWPANDSTLVLLCTYYMFYILLSQFMMDDEWTQFISHQR